MCSGLWNGLTSQPGRVGLFELVILKVSTRQIKHPRGLKAESKAAHTSLDVQKSEERQCGCVSKRSVWPQLQLHNDHRWA